MDGDDREGLYWLTREQVRSCVHDMCGWGLRMMGALDGVGVKSRRLAVYYSAE